MADLKKETVCVSCKKIRFVTRVMLYFIKIGKSTGKCKSCTSTGNQYRKNVKCSNETKIKMSLASIGRRKSLQHRKNMGIGRAGIKMPSITGENHYLWKADRTIVMEKRRLRGTIEWRKWRKSVFERDDYTCQECKKRGFALESHHIIPLKVSTNRIYDVTNGITLCVSCHKKTLFKEHLFEEKYFIILNKREAA